MRLNELYRNFLNQLSAVYTSHEAANITSMCFEALAGISRSEVIKSPEALIKTEISNKLISSLDELMQHKPVQYVLGEAWFYNLKFKVNGHVLIPRPETEELVTEAISFITRCGSKKILDVGTGSGCIPISIKKNIPETIITAVDIDEKAIAVATENAAFHQTNINFINLDFLDRSKNDTLGMFSVIISNPPYIPYSEISLMDKNVTGYEPHLALFVSDTKPLLFYEAIAAFGKTHLEADGKIFMETHEQQATHVAALFNQMNYETEIKKDIFGKERMVSAIHCR